MICIFRHYPSFQNFESCHTDLNVFLGWGESDECDLWVGWESYYWEVTQQVTCLPSYREVTQQVSCLPSYPDNLDLIPATHGRREPNAVFNLNMGAVACTTHTYHKYNKYLKTTVIHTMFMSYSEDHISWVSLGDFCFFKFQLVWLQNCVHRLIKFKCISISWVKMYYSVLCPAYIVVT